MLCLYDNNKYVFSVSASKFKCLSGSCSNVSKMFYGSNSSGPTQRCFQERHVTKSCVNTSLIALRTHLNKSLRHGRFERTDLRSDTSDVWQRSPCSQFTLWPSYTDRPSDRLPVPFSSMSHQQHQGVSSLQLLTASAVSSGAAGVPNPGRGRQEGPASPAHQSSSGRPGWSQTLQHTAAWGSLCPAPDVCCRREEESVRLGSIISLWQ